MMEETTQSNVDDLAVCKLGGMRPNWFCRHLDWTLVVGWYAILAVVVPLILLLGDTYWVLVAIVFYFVALAALLAWHLRCKQRSYLFILMWPLGWIPFVLLSNKKGQAEQEKLQVTLLRQKLDVAGLTYTEVDLPRMVACGEYAVHDGMAFVPSDLDTSKVGAVDRVSLK
ncbi:MAG: hypothetical protein HY671_12840 [Chloroflexi bacterium]|nr:hypothetical protein [Chloroflexota bacterium]